MWLLLLSLLAIKSVQSASLGYPYSSIWAYNPLKSGSVHGYLRYLDSNGAGSFVGYNNPQPVYAVRQIKYVNGAAPALETFDEETIKVRETYLRAASLQQYQSLKSDIDALRAKGTEPSAEKLLKLQMLEKIAFTSDFSLIADLPEIRSTLQDLEASVSSLYKEPVKHFRLWNEAKLRAQQTGYESGEKVHEPANKQQISALINDEHIYHPKQIASSFKNTETEKAQASAEQETPFEQQGLKSTISTLLNDQAKLKSEQVQIAHHAPEQQHLADTPEVARAREEHLRIVNEAILKAQTVPKQEQKQLQLQSFESDSEAGKAKKYSESNAQTQNLEGSSSAFSYRAEQSAIEETPEVKKAREEHLRLVHEANLRAQFVEQQELKYKHEFQTPILKSQFEHQQLVYHPETSKNVQETPEVIKAREEHLRLVNEAKLRVYKGEQNEKSIIFPLQSQQQHQQSSEIQISGDTAEVQRAREEHLRVFNSIKSHVEQDQSIQNSRIFPHPTSQQEPIVDYSKEEERALELERLRETERLQKEQQILELDRMREAGRLAEEKRQMEDELLRLRLEEEQRLEMERFLEEKRLQQEQKELQKLQNGEYQEIIIQNDSVYQQPETAFVLRTNVEQSRAQQNSAFVEKQKQQYINNPFLKGNQIVGEPANRLEHSFNQQSSFLKSDPGHVSSNTYQLKGPVPSSDNSLSSDHHIHTSHHSSEGKEFSIKDDNIKQNYHNSASSQPADSAAALLALEKATNDHFRAHELALEQLRVARIQNPALKDCN